MITLQFGASNTPLSWLVRAATGSPWSHVDFVLPDGRLLGALPGQGVRIHNQPDTRTIRLQVDAPPAVLDWALSQLGKPYDWGGALSAGLRRDWQQEDRWFCSELVMWAFAQERIRLLRTNDHHRITPGMLALSPLLQEGQHQNQLQPVAQLAQGEPPAWWPVS